MTLTEYFPNGFVLNADGRVAIGAADIFSVNKVRPVDGADDLSIGTTGTVPATYSGGQATDLVGAMLFIDVAGAKPTFAVRYVGGMPYTDYGALVIDSVGAIHSYNGGVPMTAGGLIAAGVGGGVPPEVCYLTAVVNEADFYFVMEDGRYVVLSKECQVPVPVMDVLGDENREFIGTDTDELLLV